MTLVAGVDSSTQSTKVEIREMESGRVVGRGSAPHPSTLDPGHQGRSEADPGDWWTALRESLHQAVSDGRSRGAIRADDKIAAISVAGQQHGLVALDADGGVIRPAKLWNDTETAPDAGWLMKQLPGGAASWSEACGSVPVAAFTITKLSWLHRSEPDAWERLAHVVLPHDWLNYRLTGQLVTDRGEASGTGYWNDRAGTSSSGDDAGYRYDLLAIVDKDRDWTAALPRVVGPRDRAGTIDPVTVREFVAELADAVVGAGTGDNMAVALGTALQPGDAIVSIGTSTTVFTVSDQPVVDVTGAVAGFADATGRWLPLVCLQNGTKVIAAVRRLMGLGDDDADHDRFDEWALSAPAGSGGLTMTTTFDGERTPNLPTATGTLTGLRSDVSRECLARAAVEGLVCAALDGLDALRAQTPVTGRVLLVGGGARSRAVRQVFADLCDLRVDVLEESSGPVESAAAGAAVQAAVALSGDDPLVVATRWGLGRGHCVEPSGHDSDRVTEVRQAHSALMTQMHD
jgi:xylulokinase